MDADGRILFWGYKTWALMNADGSDRTLRADLMKQLATRVPFEVPAAPELEVGGPGFCFPVLRWNGRAFAPSRHAYDGKPCTPP